MAEFRIPYEETLPTERTPVPKFETGERTNLYEMFQFDRWLKVSKQMTKGNSTFFERFFNEMMPPNICYTWEEIEKKNQRKIRIFTVNNHSPDEILFTYTGTLRLIFQKLVEHYGSRRKTYFEQRYHTKFLKIPLEKAMRIALNPPKPPKPEIIEKEVPGETVEVKVDGLVDDLEKIYNFFTSGKIDGNKALPNKFRHVKDVDVRYSVTGGLRVILDLKP